MCRSFTEARRIGALLGKEAVGGILLIVAAVLAIVGSYLPTPLRIFLLALAVVDDLLAISVIAIFSRRSQRETDH